MSENLIYDMGTKDLEAAGFERWIYEDLPHGWRAFAVRTTPKTGMYLYYKKLKRRVSIRLGYNGRDERHPDGVSEKLAAKLWEGFKTLPQFEKVREYCEDRPANTFTKEELATLYANVAEAGHAVLQYLRKLKEEDEENVAEGVKIVQDRIDMAISLYKERIKNLEEVFERLGAIKVMLYMSPYLVDRAKRVLGSLRCRINVLENEGYAEDLYKMHGSEALSYEPKDWGYEGLLRDIVADFPELN